MNNKTVDELHLCGTATSISCNYTTTSSCCNLSEDLYLNMVVDRFLDKGLVENMVMLVGQVGMFVEGMAQVGMTGKDRQWIVVEGGKDMLDMKFEWPVEEGMKEKEMEGRMQLAGREVLMVVEWCMEVQGVQLVLHKVVQLVYIP